MSIFSETSCDSGVKFIRIFSYIFNEWDNQYSKFLRKRSDCYSSLGVKAGKVI